MNATTAVRALFIHSANHVVVAAIEIIVTSH